MRITRNFKRVEFDRHGEVEPGSKLWVAMVDHLTHVQTIREAVGAPVTITRHGGYHGATFDRVWRKRSKNSQHRKARATDLVANGLTPRELHGLILRLIAEGKIPDGGLGLYVDPANERIGYVHYDTRGYRARWKGTP